MVRLSLHLLGAPAIEAGGAPLTLNHLKAQALLYYLAATPQTHTRDHLAALLWSEAPAEQARHGLRSALYRLRQALRPSGADACLVEHAHRLGLSDDERVDCDARRVRQLWAAGDERALTELVAAYGGGLLAGWHVPGAPEFERWQQTEAGALAELYAGARRRLGEWAEARGDWPAALAQAQALARHDPLEEGAQRWLMRLYQRTGADSQAVRQYQRFAAELKAELDLEPAAETQALYQAALHAQPAPAPAGGTGARAGRRLPFVGRADLLARLVAQARPARAGQGLSLLVEGEGGLGKSRLVDELAAALAAEAPPWLVLAGACSPFDDLLAYGPFIEALAGQGPGDRDEWLREAGQAAPDARGRFFWRVLDRVRGLARTAPLLLILEDLQWANSATLTLFGFLALRLRALPVLMVGTVQRAEALPALRRLLTLGRRRGELQLVTLAPLTLEAVASLVPGADANPVTVAGLAVWLHDRSGGNPFLLAEMLAQLQAQGLLSDSGAGWRLETPRWLRWRATFVLPETTHDLVAWRLANLADAERQVLDVLAVAGQPLPASLLAALLALSPADLAQTLDALLARGLARETQPEMLALPHYLVRETVLRRMSHLRRRAIHRELAQALDAANYPARAVARHAVAGEDLALARRQGLALLADLPQGDGGAETVDFLHHLHDLLAPSAALAERLRLAQALGQQHRALGQLDAAAQWNGQALRLAQQLETGPARAQAEAETHFEMAELALVSNAYQTAADAAQAGLKVLEAGAETAAQTAAQTLPGRGHRLLGAALAMEGSDLEAAERHLQAAANALRPAGQPGDLCAALFELGNVAAQRGQLARALARYQESAQAAEAGRVYYYLALAHNNLAYHNLLLGQPAAAQAAAAQGLKLAESYEMLAALSFLYSTQGEIYLYEAEWRQAAEAFQRGLTLAEELGNLERQAGYRAGLALAARGQGDLAAAAGQLDEALALIAGQGHWHLQTRLLLWQAETRRMQDQDATGPLQAALATAAAHGHVLLLIQAERLRAGQQARAGDMAGADALFAQAAARAADLDLPFESARTQAAWGLALQAGPGGEHFAERARQAAAVLASHGARGDLADLARLYGSTTAAPVDPPASQ